MVKPSQAESGLVRRASRVHASAGVAEPGRGDDGRVFRVHLPGLHRLPGAHRPIAWLAGAVVVFAAASGCTAGGSASHRPTGPAATTATASVNEASPSQGPALPTGEQPSPTTRSAPPTAQGAGEWLTYHHDVMRSGKATGQPPVSALGQVWRTALDGQLYAEPLVDGGRVIAATEHDTVYALDAATGKIVWSTNLGAPMPGRALPCGNIDPTGITGTPVIDPAHGLVWVVAFVTPGRHELIGVSLADGQVRSRRTIQLPGVDELAEQQRGALTLLGGTVYVPFGGLFGDCGNYRGFVVGLPAAGPGDQATFAVPTSREGAIWAPPGPVVDPAGNLLVATGNSASTSRYDQGDSVIALTPQLGEIGTFAPTDWARLNESDLDLGSVSPTVVGDAVFQIGKEGVGFLLDPRDLGGIGGQRYSASVCQGGSFGGTAVDATTVLIPCRSGLVALQIGPGAAFHRLWSQPAVTSGAPVIAAGRVWVVTRDGSLITLDEHTGAVASREQVSTGESSFPSLAIAGGRAFVPAGAAIVAVGGV